jgi:predicted RNA-binding Zn ribbon-like protein
MTKRQAAKQRYGFRFRGGQDAIDLPATLSGRLRPEPRELLGMPDDLARWPMAAGVAPTVPHTSEDDVATAHRLREAISALAGARAAGAAFLPPARETRDELAATPADREARGYQSAPLPC